MTEANKKLGLAKPQLISRLAKWYLRVQIDRAWLLSLCLSLSVLGASLLASRLELRTEFSALLPEQSPSVREYRRVAERLPGASKAFIILEGDDNLQLRQLGDRLVERVRTLGPPWVVSAEDGVQSARQFLLPRLLLFADQAKLEHLSEHIKEVGDRKVMQGAGLDLGLDDEAPSTEEQPAELQELKDLKAKWDNYPDGYFQSSNGKALVVVVHTALHSGEIERSQQALDRLRAVVETEVRNANVSKVRVGYAGDLVTGLSEYGAIRNDLFRVGALGCGLILLVIFLYYMHVRALLALAVAITAGSAWTFAVTQLLIGHLNVATGFLFSIVAGNGINFGIIFLGRYFEELRQGRSVPESIVVARSTTWKATLTASLAGAAAYSTLWVSEFRGLKHFAVIGAIGMLLCWVATYLFLPSVLMVFHKLVPTRALPPTTWSPFRQGLRYETPFVWLVKRFPTAVISLGVVATVVSAIAVVRSIGHDPMEYDMKRLFNQMGQAKDQKRLSTLAREIIGVKNESSMAILCDRRDQIEEMTQALHARWVAAPVDSKPFEAVHSINDFIPADQPSKIPLVETIRSQLARAQSRGLLSGTQWEQVTAYLPTETLTPFGLYDLPEAIARPFTERDGKRGRVIYIEPTHNADEDNVLYLIQWANSFRRTQLASGETVLGSGRIVIFADMIAAVLKDMPIASILSFIVTAAVVLLTVRNRRDVLLIVGGLVMGVAWLAGLFFAFKLKLNFLNFMALPITFGIGVDYAVNLVQRHRLNPEGGALSALRASGGAVILCSLTTSLGYMALLGSKNQAVHSLGLLAVFGEMCCLLAAVLVIPSIILFQNRLGRSCRSAPTKDHRGIARQSSSDAAANPVGAGVVDDPC